MEISTDLLQSLKKQTGTGLRDCKQALTMFAGDFVAASEYLRKGERDIVYYYSLYEVPGGNWLLKDDDAHDILYKVEDYLDETESTGRLDIKSAEVGLVASLEGTYPDYSHEEIQQNIETSQLRRFDCQSDTFLVQEHFLACLKQQGITEYRAYPVKFFHKATGREWPDFWFVLLTFPIFRKELLQDNQQKVFVDNEPLIYPYFNGYMKAALEQLNWSEIEFKEHEFKCCRPVALEDSIEGDRLLLKELEQLFKNKKPRYTPGSCIWEGYFIGRLLETYADVDFERVVRAIDRDQSGEFFYKRGEGASHWLGMNPQNS